MLVGSESLGVLAIVLCFIEIVLIFYLNNCDLSVKLDHIALN